MIVARVDKRNRARYIPRRISMTSHKARSTILIRARVETRT